MTIDGASGHIYMVTRDPNSDLNRLWRTTNPDTADSSAVRWELVNEFDQGLDVQLLASGAGPTGLALYGTAGYRAGGGLLGSWFGDAGDDPVLIRSFDGGHTWEDLTVT